MSMPGTVCRIAGLDEVFNFSAARIALGEVLFNFKDVNVWSLESTFTQSAKCEETHEPLPNE